jgi:hypothetical protein
LRVPPVVVVRMQPDRAWTDSGVTVQEGEELFFTAAGEVYWEARNAAAGPDGVKGYPGWSVGAGGLIGRVETSKIFALGTRTQLFLAPNPRGRRHYYAPPPLRMPATGRLMLGFKDFKQGNNLGEFEITVRRPGKT